MKNLKITQYSFRAEDSKDKNTVSRNYMYFFSWLFYNHHDVKDM